MSTIKKGIDVSEHQGIVDWGKVSTDFVILRAGYGREINQKDKQFDTNYKGCKDHSIPCGAYWYSYALTVEDAIKEAKTCLEVIKGKTFEYPIYFDVEESSQFNLGRERVSAIIKAFLEYVESAGYWVGLYMSQHYLENYVTEDIRKRFAVWVAQYNTSCTYSGQYGIWQYGIAGNVKYDTANVKSVKGVKGECDCDNCYIDYPSLIKNKGLNGFKKSPTPTGGSVSSAPKKDTNYNIYTVVKGDNLWNIAQKYLKNGSRYTEIKKLNGLTSDTIYPGDKLKIPKY